MTLFSFHLAETSLGTTVRAMRRPPMPGHATGHSPAGVPGLVHAECLAAMTLGSPIVSRERMRWRQLAVFARWEDEAALETFLAGTDLGARLAAGWHVRLELLRRWGHVAGFGDLPAGREDTDPDAPVVAVTLARLRLTQLPRFIRWGRPTESLVRDHPGATLALAAMRPPRTFSTFTVWRSLRAMTDMVHGRGNAPGIERHAAAMRERERRDFHHEFTTLRFGALSEHGAWQGRRNIVPGLDDSD